MRAWLLIFAMAACGPMYGNPQQQPPASAPPSSGPPGGAADPWSASDEPAAPTDPYANQAPPPARKPAPPAQRGGAPAGMQAILDAHNRVRAKHCAQPLAWSPKLAAVAQDWAASLKKQGCKFGHRPNNAYGENLAAGTSGALDGESVLGMWYDEIKLYDFKSGGFSMETGHFTQVVWRDTSQVGCAMTTCKGMDIWVCEYDPPGNVQTLYRKNVLPTGCK